MEMLNVVGGQPQIILTAGTILMQDSSTAMGCAGHILLQLLMIIIVLRVLF